MANKSCMVFYRLFAIPLSGFRMALLQMFVEYHREQNLAKAARMIKEAANHGAKVVALPVSKPVGVKLS